MNPVSEYFTKLFSNEGFPLSDVGIWAAYFTIISLLTLFALILVLPQAMSLRNPRELENLNIQIQQLVSRYESMVSHAKDAIISIDNQSVVTLWNTAAASMFGYSAEEALGKEITALIIPVEDKNAYPNGLTLVPFEGESPLMNKTVEITAKHRSGEIFPIELSLFRSGLEGQEEYTTFIRNISERKKFEDQLKHTNEVLEQKAQQLETLNKELETFSYSVSHDLRAPLRAINGFSQALLESAEKKLDETEKDYISRVCAGSQHMGKLIEGMLNLSQLTRQTFSMESNINLSTMATDIAKELRQQEPDRKVIFDIQENIFVQGDKQLLNSVLQNLLGNAWKYTAKNPSAHIEFGTLPDKPTVYFIKDDGVGFDMTYADKLFGVFQRLHSNNDFPGTGIGLATVARIIRRHGGNIWAESMPEEGATFYFTLDTLREK